MRIAVCLFLLSCLLTGAQCRSNGAPNEACDAVAPSITAHGADPQTSAVPYVLTGLPANNMNYTPGMTYNLTLSGDQDFKGFLVIAMNSAGQRVGSWTTGSDSQTTCADSRGVTHTGSADKASVSVMWTAPPMGTGQVDVRFAVVRVQTMYWANQLAATLQETQPQPEPSTSPDMPTPSATSSAFSDMPTPSTSSMTEGSATPSASQSPSPTATPEGDDGNSTPSNGPGSLAAILLAGVAFVVVAVLA